MEWYKIKRNIIDLLFFLIDIEQITTSEEVLDLVDHPIKYNDVWTLYRKEIMGDY